MGLAIGLCSCMLIGIFIQNELSYDQFEKKGDRIARVIMDYSFAGSKESKQGNFTSMKVAPTLRRKFPEVENAVRMYQTQRIISYKDKLLDEKKFMFADSTFFKIFSLSLLEGNIQHILNLPHQVIVTKSTAQLYFGNEEPIGKLIQVGTDSIPFVVTGVIQDCPVNSQFKFNFLASFTTLDVVGEEQSYWDANYTTYVLLKNPTAEKTLEQKINEFMQKEMAGQGASIQFHLEPFMRIHLYSEFDGFEPNGNIKYIYILEGVAVLLLIIAGFTYINLNMARSVERAKEVGVRKVIGAGRGQLFWQFIGESVILCLIAVTISFIGAFLLLPSFNNLTGENLLSGRSDFISGFNGSCDTYVAGKHFSRKLSCHSVVKYHSRKSVKRFIQKHRFGTMDAQVSYYISIFHFSFADRVDVHHAEDNFILFRIRMSVTIGSRFLYCHSTRKCRIKSISLNRNLNRMGMFHPFHICRSTPVRIQSGYNMRSSEMPEKEQIVVTADQVDEEYIKTTGLQLIAGTNLNQQDLKDIHTPDGVKPVFHFILNESAARELGWSPEQAIGKKMFLDESRPGFVKGVIKDFNFESLHQSIKPLVLFPVFSGRALMLKLNGGHIPETIAFLESKWKTLVPHRPFEFHFLDEDFNSLYESELRLGKVLNVFAGMAIALACLGLVGLSSYTTKQRQKEIGIRKVLGAGVHQVVQLLSVEYIKLVLAAILIASPVAWVMMSRWLQDYAYHIPIQWWVFAISGLVVILIALMTVSVQVIKAAISNPVRSLKTE